jgi:hypothetical protein
LSDIEVTLLLINFHDFGVKRSKLFGCFLNELLLPGVSDFFKLSSGLDRSTLVLVFLLGFQEFFNVSERSSNDIHKEVIHKVSIIPLECQI